MMQCANRFAFYSHRFYQQTSQVSIKWSQLVLHSGQLVYCVTISFVFTACLYVFPACLADMLPTVWLKTGRLPKWCPKCLNQISYVYNRPVCFQVWVVCVHILFGGGVLVLNQDKTAKISTNSRDPQHNRFQVCRAIVCTQSRGGSVK